MPFFLFFQRKTRKETNAEIMATKIITATNHNAVLSNNLNISPNELPVINSLELSQLFVSKAATAKRKK